MDRGHAEPKRRWAAFDADKTHITSTTFPSPITARCSTRPPKMLPRAAASGQLCDDWRGGGRRGIGGSCSAPSGGWILVSAAGASTMSMATGRAGGFQARGVGQSRPDEARGGLAGQIQVPDGGWGEDAAATGELQKISGHLHRLANGMGLHGLMAAGQVGNRRWRGGGDANHTDGKRTVGRAARHGRGFPRVSYLNDHGYPSFFRSRP